MEYKNRGKRCPHGILIGITCPGCYEPKKKHGREAYTKSEGPRRQVTHNRDKSAGEYVRGYNAGPRASR